jgi:hypothetical protein
MGSILLFKTALLYPLEERLNSAVLAHVPTRKRFLPDLTGEQPANISKLSTISCKNIDGGYCVE